MQIKVFNINSVLINQTLLSQLRKLTLHSKSGMNIELDNFEKISKTRKVNAKAIVAYDEIPIAWALLSQEQTNFNFFNGTKYNAGYGNLFEVFVHESYRRKGVASLLLRKAKLLSPTQRICIAPHDYKSHAFFDKNRHLFRFKDL